MLQPGRGGPALHHCLCACHAVDHRSPTCGPAGLRACLTQGPSRYLPCSCPICQPAQAQLPRSAPFSLLARRPCPPLALLALTSPVPNSCSSPLLHALDHTSLPAILILAGCYCTAAPLSHRLTFYNHHHGRPTDNFHRPSTCARSMMNVNLMI